MSSLAQLPGPGLAPSPAASARPAPPSANPAMLTVPVLQQPSPYWVDPAAVAAAPPPAQHIHYIAVAPPPPPPPPPPPSASPAVPTSVAPAPAAPSEPPAPRPRKPYTTTKVREMWSPTEHERMLEGLRLFKRDWAKVTRYVGTRSAAQVRSHAQKYFDKVARDKTDDYVPRARPKRKSATPYPRKARDEPTQHQSPVHPPHSHHSLQIPQPTNSVALPITIPVPPIHPAAMSVQQQPAIPHPHPIHHPSVPVQLTAQSPLLSQMTASSPCLAQPPQQNMTVQQGLPQHVYSPYVAMYPPPAQDPQRIQTSPVPHPSPMSLIGSPYTGHSPATHQQLYSVFSPMTPGGFPADMGRSPAVNQSQVSLVAAPHMQTHPAQHQHIPTHSHPGGPMENCAKCAALQRYGNVLQEIGEFRHPAMPQSGHAAIPEAVQTAVPGQTATSMPLTEYPPGLRRLDRPSRADAMHKINFIVTPSQEGSGTSSGKRRSDGSSCPSAEDVKQNGAAKGAADHRAHRAKVMKARKAKNRIPRVKSTSKSASAGDSEESNESFNSSRIKHADESKGKDKRTGSLTPTKAKASHKRGSGSLPSEVNTKRKPRTSESDEERPTKRLRRPNPGQVYGKKVSSEDLSSKLPDLLNGSERSSGNSSPETKLACDKSDQSDGKRTNSPVVDTYSPSERKEIFDAVKSLQILAKTSSSSSPEPRPVASEKKSET